MPFGDRFFEVSAPVLPERSLVLLASPSPMAYVIPWLPTDARFVGGNSNLSAPGEGHRYERHVQSVVLDHAGPLFTLALQGERIADVLRDYGLTRTDAACASIFTNMKMSPLEICPVARNAQLPQAAER